MSVFLIDEYVTSSEFRPDLATLRTIRVERPDELLDAGYRLLEHVFDPAVLDTKATYIDLLSPGGTLLDGFSLVCVVAVFDHGDDQLVAGIGAGNLMWIDTTERVLQLAIGNIATSPTLRTAGFRGVGSAVWKAMLDAAKLEAHKQGGEVAYSVAEAEPESLGFWKRLGYLRPQGVQYLQPPLEFDDDGRPAYAEVPETLLVAPLDNPEQQQIDSAAIRQMVLAIYRNWSIETNRSTLSPTALAAAEAYVMQRVFPQVDATIPTQGSVRFVSP